VPTAFGDDAPIVWNKQNLSRSLPKIATRAPGKLLDIWQGFGLGFAPHEKLPSHMKSLVFLILATVTFGSSTFAQKGGVAILDIDAVAKELGVEEQVRVTLLSMQESLNAELQKAQSTLQAQMNGVEQAAGENPTDEKKQEVLATNQQLNSEFNRLKMQAEQNLVQERVRLINDFRIKLEPVALEVAKGKGFDVVLMKVTPPLFASSPEVDITADTAKLAKSKGMQVPVTPAAPAPAATPAAPKPAAGGN
jgi:Skp family chaperone for outer membrane proteins